MFCVAKPRTVFYWRIVHIRCIHHLIGTFVDNVIIIYVIRYSDQIFCNDRVAFSIFLVTLHFNCFSVAVAPNLSFFLTRCLSRNLIGCWKVFW